MCEEATSGASGYEHEHVHTHADGTTHSHLHTHSGDHGYDHSHDNGHGHHHHHHGDASTEATDDEKLAMLRYMLDHNRDHAEELAGLSMTASEEVEAVLAHALKHFNQTNELLADYIRKVEGR